MQEVNKAYELSNKEYMFKINNNNKWAQNKSTIQIKTLNNTANYVVVQHLNYKNYQAYDSPMV